MLKHITIAAALLVASCKKEKELDLVAPPIEKGKCIADIYERNVAKKQTCTHVGYQWDCNEHSCKRRPEAVGERPIEPPPVLTPAAPAVGSGSAQ